jgi:predicted DNA-binding transcriptional regulator YafY
MSNPFQPSSDTEVTIQTALAQNRDVSFEYTDAAGRVTSRSVKPIVVRESKASGNRVFFAWCHKRDAQRCFFIHAMRNVAVVDGE